MKKIQATSMQEQQQLDEESLQRIKAAEEAKKVHIHVFTCWPTGFAKNSPGNRHIKEAVIPLCNA